MHILCLHQHQNQQIDVSIAKQREADGSFSDARKFETNDDKQNDLNFKSERENLQSTARVQGSRSIHAIYGLYYDLLLFSDFASGCASLEEDDDDEDDD